MKLSHIICSMKRPDQLKVVLEKIDRESLTRHNVEVLLVGFASDKPTMAVMEAFARQAPTRTYVLHQDRRGLGAARNVGITAASGDFFTFTDDDCYLQKDYYDALLRDFDPTQYQYGAGQVLLFDPSDDRRIAICPIAEKSTIRARSLLPAGLIPGANMFALRSVFDRIGGFSEDFGGAAPFAGDDVEFATRASLAGFTGVLLPSVIVHHHHGRKPGSPESEAQLEAYDIGRGAYYAVLLTRGINESWQLWSRFSAAQGPISDALAVRLEREFRGAADYLKYYLSKKDRAG